MADMNNQDITCSLMSKKYIRGIRQRGQGQEITVNNALMDRTYDFIRQTVEKSPVKTALKYYVSSTAKRMMLDKINGTASVFYNMG